MEVHFLIGIENIFSKISIPFSRPPRIIFIILFIRPRRRPGCWVVTCSKSFRIPLIVVPGYWFKIPRLSGWRLQVMASGNYMLDIPLIINHFATYHYSAYSKINLTSIFRPFIRRLIINWNGAFSTSHTIIENSGPYLVSFHLCFSSVLCTTFFTTWNILCKNRRRKK